MTPLSPFPYFGGKCSVAASVWGRLGSVKQYLEPFCGSAAVLLACPRPASLEVACDSSGFIANFWRAAKHLPAEVAEAADYPVSHVDLGARHAWLMAQRGRVGDALQDPDWPGDAKVAGWWLWGQCCWIGTGWCEWDRPAGEVPHHPDAGRGVQAVGKVPHHSDPGRCIQAVGKVPHLSTADDRFLTSAGRVASAWLSRLAARLERVRLIHGDWTRCLNVSYGGTRGGDVAVFLDPPYRSYEALYGGGTSPVAAEVAEWARANAHLRVALCGLLGDYDLPGWDPVAWSRGRFTYGGSATTAAECVWYSPACLPANNLLSLLYEDDPT